MHTLLLNYISSLVRVPYVREDDFQKFFTEAEKDRPLMSMLEERLFPVLREGARRLLSYGAQAPDRLRPFKEAISRDCEPMELYVPAGAHLTELFLFLESLRQLCLTLLALAEDNGWGELTSYLERLSLYTELLEEGLDQGFRDLFFLSGALQKSPEDAARYIRELESREALCLWEQCGQMLLYFLPPERRDCL